MLTLDIILLILFIPGIIAGVSKGFVEQLIGIASLVAGVWAAFRFSSGISVWIASYIDADEKIIKIAAFIVTAVIAVVILHLLGNLIVKAMEAVSLGWFNRLLGLVFGVFKTALILGLIIMAFESVNSKWHFVEKEKTEDAVVYGALKQFSDKVFPYLKDLASEVKDTVKTDVANV